MSTWQAEFRMFFFQEKTISNGTVLVCNAFKISLYFQMVYYNTI